MNVYSIIDFVPTKLGIVEIKLVNSDSFQLADTASVRNIKLRFASFNRNGIKTCLGITNVSVQTQQSFSPTISSPPCHRLNVYSNLEPLYYTSSTGRCSSYLAVKATEFTRVLRVVRIGCAMQTCTTMRAISVMFFVSVLIVEVPLVAQLDL